MIKDILIIDDEVGIRELLYEILKSNSFQPRHAANGQDARVEISKRMPDLILLDIWMPDVDGLTLLREWVEEGKITMPVIVMSGHASIDSAIEATKIGASAFLEKPFSVNKLLALIKECEKKYVLETQKKKNKEIFSNNLVEKNENLEYEINSYKIEKTKFETNYFKKLLDYFNGNMTKISQTSGMDRTHLYRKLKILGIKFKKGNKNSG
mgnify:FL=1